MPAHSQLPDKHRSFPCPTPGSDRALLQPPGKSPWEVSPWQSLQWFLAPCCLSQQPVSHPQLVYALSVPLAPSSSSLTDCAVQEGASFLAGGLLPSPCLVTAPTQRSYLELQEQLCCDLFLLKLPPVQHRFPLLPFQVLRYEQGVITC